MGLYDRTEYVHRLHAGAGATIRMSIDYVGEGIGVSGLPRRPDPRGAPDHAPEPGSVGRLHAKMSPRYRELIELRFFREFSYEESPQNSRSRWERSKSRYTGPANSCADSSPKTKNNFRRFNKPHDFGLTRPHNHYPYY